MASTLSIIQSTAANKGPGYVPQSRSPRFTLRTDDKKYSHSFPWGPTDISLSNIAISFTQATRAGRVPLLLPEGPQLVTMTYTLTLGYKDQRTVQSDLDALTKLSRATAHIEVIYSSYIQGLWRITSLGTEITQWNVAGHPSRATASVEMTRSSDAAVFSAPTAGGKKTTPRSKASTPTKAKKQTIYTVKKSDTLWRIALQHYGDGSKWRRIADANHLRSSKLKPGQKLVLP